MPRKIARSPSHTPRSAPFTVSATGGLRSSVAISCLPAIASLDEREDSGETLDLKYLARQAAQSGEDAMIYRKRDAKDYAREHLRGIWAAAMTPFAADLS